MGKLIKFREKNLLLRSEITKGYPDLIRFINDTPDLDERLLTTLSGKMQIFFRDIYPRVLQQSIHEWTNDKHKPIELLDDRHKIRCQLCNARIKNVCHIENRLNGNRLKVGTECVKHFGMECYETIQQLLKGMERTKKLEQLNLRFPGIERKIYEWVKFIDSRPIFIPERLVAPYLRLGEEAREVFNNHINANFVSKRDTADTYLRLKNIFREQKLYFDEINEYVEKNDNNKFIPKRETIKWLRANNKVQTLQWIKEDSQIRHRTIFRIQEPNFVRSMIKNFNSVLSPLGVRIERVIMEPSPAYIMTHSANTRIKLRCKYSKLAIEFGGIVTGEEARKKPSINKLLKNSQIYDEVSLATALEEIEYFTRTKLSFIEPRIDLDDVIIYDKISSKYFTAKITEIADTLKMCLFDEKLYNDAEITEKILSKTKRHYNYEEIQNIIELRQET